MQIRIQCRTKRTDRSRSSEFGIATGQFVDLAAHKRVGKCGVAPDDWLGKQFKGLFARAGRAPRVQAAQAHRRCALARQLGLGLLAVAAVEPRLFAAGLQARAGGSRVDLLLEVTTHIHLQSQPDIPGTVLKFALALKIQSVEQNLCNCFRIFLVDESLSKLGWDSLVGQQFLQINSNLKPAFRRQPKRRSRNRD